MVTWVVLLLFSFHVVGLWHVLEIGGGLWFFILHLWISIKCFFGMAFVLICLNVFLIFMIMNFSCSSRHFIEGMCVASLVATITMGGATFHPFVVRIFKSGWYIVVFIVMHSLENMSLQYANSINYKVGIGVGVTGLLYG